MAVGLTLLFFDTEFSRSSWDAKLISIGCVDIQGHEFYAELSDTYDVSDCSAFVCEEVLPHLQGGNIVMTRFQLVLALGNWIEGLSGQVQLTTDAEDWDWSFIVNLFSEPGTWPSNLTQHPAVLGNTDAMSTFTWVRTQIVSDHCLREHHSLDDARRNRLTYMSVGEFKCLQRC